MAALADATDPLGAAVSAASKAIAVTVPAGAPEYCDVVDWLYREARMLDQGEFNSWLALMAPEIIYTMPTRTAVNPKDGQGFDHDFGLFAENHASLSARVARLNTDQAWAEQPRSRTRHFVSNIIVERESNTDLKVTAAFMLTRLRSNRPLDIFTGERQDTLRRDGKLLKLARRLILLDQTVIESHNLSIFF
jgi:3-phenylpropionate/cinnamic acid dioxygenase small subunit